MKEHDDAMIEVAEWLANIGYPVQMCMPGTLPPAPLWEALIDVIHRDTSGHWHGNELSRVEVKDWLENEAGIARKPEAS